VVAGLLVVQYRAFRNTDPPSLAAIWNEAFTGRGEARLRHSSPLENYVFAKPYFDAAGLILAEEENVPVGFVHAGFGPNDTQSALATDKGTICALGVRPSHRRKGIGSELLRRGEEYLHERGAKALFAGPMAPLDPFYFALHGGSDLPGFLESESEAGPFLQRHGYQADETCLVFQRVLSQPMNVVDARFALLRRRFEVRIVPRAGTISWWQEAVLGPVELVEFRLEEKLTGHTVARAAVWEMDLFSWRWNTPSVGLLEVQTREELRRQGLAKYLLAQTLRYLQDQFFGLVEFQVREPNATAIALIRGLGFEQVDKGHRYKKAPGTPST
jgi:ribosomal protein S18 acetylase RimI-like enzyme